jgi:hypothetical protein
LAAIASAVLASRVTIANDCGPSHVAQMLGRPYVGLFANDRGQAEQLVREWFFPRPAASWLSPPVGTDINQISPDTVYERMLSVLPPAPTDCREIRRRLPSGLRARQLAAGLRVRRRHVQVQGPAGSGAHRAPERAI